MDLMILDTNKDPVCVLDIYNSFIWTDRYFSYGDFELHASVSDELLECLKQDYYIVNANSEHVMIIEKLLINSDIENGNTITVSGRSLESLLERRIIWNRTTLSGNLQNGIKKLLNENVISPSDSNRKIDNFIFEESTDSAITGLTIDGQYTGDNLYEAIASICQENSIGFKISLNDSKQFVFKLYSGVDRSYDQTTYPYVVFSPNFENIVESNYMESKMALKNVTLVGGEGEGTARRYASVGTAVGLDRRELFTDARDIRAEDDEGNTISDSEYSKQLVQRGREKLAENVAVVAFEGQADVTSMFVYGVDFFMGDIVQIADEYGHETKSRMVELVSSESEEGVSTYPTFASVDDNT